MKRSLCNLRPALCIGELLPILGESAACAARPQEGHA